MQKHLQVLLIAILALYYTKAISQNNLPVGFSVQELIDMQRADYHEPSYPAKGITTPPSGPVRNMAQWEEVQGLTITWTSYESVLREVVRAARKETQVYIVCGFDCSGSSDSTTIKNYLTSGGVPLSNVNFIYAPCNSVWARDYSANSVYLNDVDSLILVDWKYNRPTRIDDDTVCRSVARKLDLQLYETTQTPNKLIHTGGNYMTDGMGTGFSSELIEDENPTLTETQIDNIMNNFMGIDRYIKMPTLPYDGIHHIDMHMKLLNEETLLMGEYPAGIADGPQIEANLQYVLSTFNSSFGTPYKVIRIPMPPDQYYNYYYPDNDGNYLTYTNSVIVNKTVIVPQFYTQYDTTALRIWKEAMPGYTIAGVNSNNTISASGSIHCITHSVGVREPLRIVHQNLPNTANTTTPYQVDAIIQHKSGIQSATLYYTTDTTQPFASAVMTLTGIPTDTWTGYIPAQPAGSRIFYYIKAVANSGKQQVRPMPAPLGTFKFDVLLSTSLAYSNTNELFAKPAFPNPSHGITCIPVTSGKNAKGTIKLVDMLGNTVITIHDGNMPAGEKNYFANTAGISKGAYLLVIETEDKRSTQKLMIK
ncbi:MAG: agmatine deiminase family protein [Bacteroidia bacterium]